MGLLLRLSLFLTVVSCVWSEESDERVGNYDRIITVCTEGKMEIHLRKDFEAGFMLKGNESECQPVMGTFTDYDGSSVQVKTWTLPLNESDGPCGLKFLPRDDSPFWKYTITIFGPDRNRTASCTRTGVLDKRGATIRIEQVTPRIRELKGNGRPVEVESGSTLSAFFSHRFHDDISLHPIDCWIINERRHTRRIIVEDGCPLLNSAGNQTIVTLGAESADMTTGDHAHVFFNAESSLFENENPSAPPPFRIQCSVMPCKGLSLHQQFIGINRCPAIAQCQFKKKIAQRPTDTFEINQDFSLTISSSSSVPPSKYRPLIGPIYNGEYMMTDTYFRPRQMDEPEEEKVEWGRCLLSLVVVALLLALIAVTFHGYLRYSQDQTLREVVHKYVTAFRATVIRPEKKSADALVKQYNSLPLNQVD